MNESVLSPFKASVFEPPRAFAEWALLLDLDGTLLDFASAPDEVIVPPGLVGDLQATAELLDNAVALISGRQLAEIDALLAPLRLPAAGEHGAVIRLIDGRRDELDCRVPAAWIAHIDAELGPLPGIFIERKTHSIALHFRRAPQVAARVARVAEALVAEDRDHFELLSAHMAVEIRPIGATKGRAVERLMAEAPFRGRVPIYVGDDVTDEDGARAARALGGVGLFVGVAFEGQPRLVRRWLRSIATSGRIGIRS